MPDFAVVSRHGVDSELPEVSLNDAQGWPREDLSVYHLLPMPDPLRLQDDFLLYGS
jgi:hypothetical protein